MGTIHGAKWVDGKYGNALSFDGRDDYVDYGIGSSLNFPADASFTVSLWIKTSKNYGPLVSQRNSIYGAPVLDVTVGYDGTANNYPGKVRFIIRDDDYVGQVEIGSTTSVNDDIWHFVVAVRDGSDDKIKLYIDGSLESASGAKALNSPITTNIRAIGNERRWVQDSTATADKRWFNGIIDEVRIYNRALTADEIKAGESRTFQYTIRSRDTGKFDLGQATATYADEEGNYHTVKSNSPMVEVMVPLEKPKIPRGEEGEKKGMPGFEAVFAIAGLLAAAYFLKKRK